MASPGLPGMEWERGVGIQPLRTPIVRSTARATAKPDRGGRGGTERSAEDYRTAVNSFAVLCALCASVVKALGKSVEPQRHRGHREVLTERFNSLSFNWMDIDTYHLCSPPRSSASLRFKLRGSSCRMAVVGGDAEGRHCGREVGEAVCYRIAKEHHACPLESRKTRNN